MLKNIEQEFLSTEFADTSEDYIAIALYINGNGVGEHSGILISIGGELKLFHFDSKNVLIDNIENVNDGKWYYSKKIELIHPEEVLTFLSHCELIKESATPTWALIFDGSYYKKEDGLYFTKSGLKEYTTCVGFCINVISAFLNNQEYFDLNTWDISSVESFRLQYSAFYDNMLEKIRSENQGAFDKIESNYLKRITPTEYTISGFLNSLPIRKEDIDPHYPVMEKYIFEERENDSSF